MYTPAGLKLNSNANILLLITFGLVIINRIKVSMLKHIFDLPIAYIIVFKYIKERISYVNSNRSRPWWSR